MRIYGAARTWMGRVLGSGEVTPEAKARLAAEEGRLSPLAMKREIEAGRREIVRLKRWEARE